MSDILKRIVAKKRKELKRQKEKMPLSELKKNVPKSVNDFRKALSLPGLSLIAELKKASPSKGTIRENFNYLEIAAIYEKYAQAISVLTDETFFGGSFDYLKNVAEQSTLPLLCKDFIIDEYQIFRARISGANAILLIASLLDKETLNGFLDIAKSLGMDALVEVHDEEDLKKIENSRAEIIGINNRDLKTFRTDIETTVRLAKMIPKNLLIVSESGFYSAVDIKRVRKIADAVLVGTSFMASEDIEEKMKEFEKIMRTARSGIFESA